jgi:hypothetical protein
MIPGSLIIWRRRVVARMRGSFSGPRAAAMTGGLFYDPCRLSMAPWTATYDRLQGERGTNGHRQARVLVRAASLLAVPAAAWAQNPDRVVFGTNWRAQAEHGGFYQAVATGLYGKRGLDVTIRQGGPQINSAQLLAAGRLDLQHGREPLRRAQLSAGGVPIVTVAAIFQKDPQVLMAHPGQGNDSLAALKGKPIMISAGAQSTYWQFLKHRFGYTDAQIRPYTFQLAPFLADRKAIQRYPRHLQGRAGRREAGCPHAGGRRLHELYDHHRDARRRRPGQARPRPALRGRLDRGLVQLPRGRS